MLELSESTRLMQSEMALAAEFDGGLMMMDPVEGRYYQLNQSSQAIWELLATPRTQAELVEALQQQFSTSAPIDGEVTEALQKLHQLGLVVVA